MAHSPHEIHQQNIRIAEICKSNISLLRIRKKKPAWKDHLEELDKEIQENERAASMAQQAILLYEQSQQNTQSVIPPPCPLC